MSDEPSTDGTRRGAAGGRAVLEKYGVDHLRGLGQKGGAATHTRYGRAHMQSIGRKGFAVTVARHFGGDRRLAINTLIQRGLMAIDPMPHNGAWTRDDIPNRLPPPLEQVPDAHDDGNGEGGDVR